MDHERRRTVVQHIFEFADGQTPVQKHCDRARSGAGELDVEIRDAILREQSHSVATPNAERAEIGRHGVDPSIEIGVGEAPAGSEFAYRLFLRTMRGVVRDPIVGSHGAVPGRPGRGHRRQFGGIGKQGGRSLHGLPPLTFDARIHQPILLARSAFSAKLTTYPVRKQAGDSALDAFLFCSLSPRL